MKRNTLTTGDQSFNANRIYDIKTVYDANEFLAIETDTTRP